MEHGVTQLGVEKAGRFLDRLAEDPFVAVVLAEDSDPNNPRVVIYSKGMDQAHVDRIKTALKEIEEG